MKGSVGIAAALLLLPLWLKPAEAAPSFQQTGNTLVMSNGDVLLEYNLNAGTTDFYWQNSKKISGFYSGVGLNTGYIKGISYSSWRYSVSGSNEVIVTATGSGLPTMVQYFTLDQNDSFLVRLSVAGTNLSANWMGPVVVDTSGWVHLGITNDNRALVVPFDNDGFVAYNAMPMNSSAIGYELGAFYDNNSRNGLVVGSVTHDTWKTGVYFSGVSNQLTLMNVFGGATSPWDVMPHGFISGNTISSPTVFVGFGADWRVTMQDFAAENTNFAPRLPWTNGVPFGWNSWGVIQTNINYTDAIAASDYIYVNLMGENFNDNGTAYVNLDSYWNNLSDSQLQSFASHCHAHGEKAGVYLGPFVWFGAAADATNTVVEGTTNTYHYSDILLRDGEGDFETVDGGLAVDPTHPGAKERIYYYINLFTNWGFDYVKLDFLSHGALEGVHYDTNVTTGIQAYNQGMQYVLNVINGSMFMSESISPLFPYKYGHSRRIACDAYTSLISNTEYTMNSVSYGWWLGNLYQFNDPDIMVFSGYGATTNENQTRLISGAVTGVFLDGDDLSGSSGQNAAQEMLTNAGMDDVARTGQTFTPVEGDTGTNAANIFVRQQGTDWWIAVFNYTGSATNETVDFDRAGLPPRIYNATDLWNGTTTVSSGSLNVSLDAKQSKLFEFTPYTPASLKWSPSNNSGVWDTGMSTNWMIVTNGQASVFNTNDPVLFDDTVGVPTLVKVSGTVSPNLITVNSSTNAFVFANSGTIASSAGLLKEGTSLLGIYCTGDLSGPVSIGGGAIYAGNNCFALASSITVSNGATLDLGGSTFSGTPVTVSGTGLNGEGALYNSFTGDPQEVLNITMAGDTKFGGSQRWDFATGAAIGGPHNLTVDWSAGAVYGQWNSVSIGADVESVTVTNGSSLGMVYMDSSCQNPGTVFGVSPNSQLVFYDGGFNGSLLNGGSIVIYNPNIAFSGTSIHLLGGSVVTIYTPGVTFNGGGLTFENNSSLQTFDGSGYNSVDCPVAFNGVAHLVLGNHAMVYTNVLSGSGGFVLDYYDNDMILSATNTYSGPTIIGSSGNSPEVALTGTGSISESSLIFFGGTNPAVAHMDVSGRTDNTLTLASGQTLAGIGGIVGNLVASAGSTISPAGSNTTIGITTGANSTGIIGVTGSVTLSGTTVIKLDGSGVNDAIVSSGGGITYGGVLNLVNISGSPLASGDSFQVFSGTSYGGSFASITPATPGPGLAWGISQLNIGVLNVVPAPIITSVAESSGSLVFSGTNGTGTEGGTYYVLTTTNLATPLTNWVKIATNTFGANGAFNVTNAVSPGSPQKFYCIEAR